MFENKLNVLLLIPEVNFGGAEKSFSALSESLSKKYNVVVVLFNQIETPIYTLGGQIIDLNTPPATNPIYSVLNILKRWIKIKRIKKEYNIQVSISFLEGANYLNILTRLNDKIIISIRGSKEHDININGFKGFIRKRILVPTIYKKADRIVCISKGLKRELINKYKLDEKRILINYNFIDTEKIKHLCKEKINIDDQKIFNGPVLISHCRLSREKGLQFQLAILKELLVKNSEFKLILIGEGNFKEKLIDKCKELNLIYYERSTVKFPIANANVIFWGYSKNPYTLIKRGDLFLSTSLSEGFGNSIAEAMACKIPVLSTDCPYGPKEIIIPEFEYETNSLAKYPIYHKNGILLPIIKNLIDNESIRIWVNTIENIIQKKDELFEITKHASLRIEDFNIQKNLNSWLEVIK